MNIITLACLGDYCVTLDYCVIPESCLYPSNACPSYLTMAPECFTSMNR